MCATNCPHIDVVALAGLLDHLAECGKREDAFIEGVDHVFLAIGHVRLKRFETGSVRRTEPNERTEVQSHLSESG
jgi:hypothetical protein